MDIQQQSTSNKRGPRDWREVRRLQAWKLKQKGWKQADIAEALGVTEGAVSQWVKAARTEGEKALHAQKHQGPKPALSAEQLAQLPGLLAKGAPFYGFHGERWTRARVAQIIQRHFGVRFCKQYVGRLLKKIAWTPQKPQKKASQRNEAAIEAWRGEKWPAIKKSDA